MEIMTILPRSQGSHNIRFLLYDFGFFNTCLNSICSCSWGRCCGWSCDRYCGSCRWGWHNCRGHFWCYCGGSRGCQGNSCAGSCEMCPCCRAGLGVAIPRLTPWPATWFSTILGVNFYFPGFQSTFHFSHHNSPAKLSTLTVAGIPLRMSLNKIPHCANVPTCSQPVHTPLNTGRLQPTRQTMAAGVSYFCPSISFTTGTALCHFSPYISVIWPRLM